MKVAIHLIDPNPNQPRTIFDESELAGLAKTVAKHGVILPLAVEPKGDRYILIDGERRLRAAKLAGLKEIDVEIKPSTNGRGTDRLTKALIANVQRSAMGPLDEARAYQALIRDLGTAEAVAEEVGVSNATVSMRLSLLEFPEQVQKLYNLKRLPMDAKVIAAFKRLKSDQQISVATRSAIRSLNHIAILKLITRELKKRGKTYAPKKREKKEIQFDGHFNALALINGKKLPDNIRQAAILTCQKCSLYPEAGPSICRECPLPDFLRRVDPGEA
jgi:ParB family transcriptional regulator, chromosome partitioning protein